MPFDHHLDGRHEKRLPIAVVVRLASLNSLRRDGDEKTYTDNVSAHGARVVSSMVWKPAKKGQVIRLKYGQPANGKVIFCGQFPTAPNSAGLNSPNRPAPWSNSPYPASTNPPPPGPGGCPPISLPPLACN